MLKAHKRYCVYKNCHCEKCKETTTRQKLMAIQTANRRAGALDAAMIQNSSLVSSHTTNAEYRTFSEINNLRIPDEIIINPQLQTQYNSISGNTTPPLSTGELLNYFNYLQPFS